MVKKGYVYSEGPTPKEFRKLFKKDALVCVDGCNIYEQKADKDIKKVLELEKQGRLSCKQSEAACEAILFKAKKSQRRK